MTTRDFKDTLGMTLVILTIVGMLYASLSDSTARPEPQLLPLDSSFTARLFPEKDTLRDSEVLWLARCIYSETKQPHEMQLVGWVVRNRVEARRHPDTYEEVVLEPWQFSAFNHNNPKRYRLMRLSYDDQEAHPVWALALKTAADIYAANESERLWPRNVLHFYSPRSMRPRGAEPHWADTLRPVHPPVAVDPDRFRFFAKRS